jgi:hypothetical protein
LLLIELLIAVGGVDALLLTGNIIAIAPITIELES